MSLTLIEDKIVDITTGKYPVPMRHVPHLINGKLNHKADEKLSGITLTLPSVQQLTFKAYDAGLIPW